MLCFDPVYDWFRQQDIFIRGTAFIRSKLLKGGSLYDYFRTVKDPEEFV